MNRTITQWITLLVLILFVNSSLAACPDMPQDPCNEGFYAGPCGGSRANEFCCFECNLDAPPPAKSPISPPIAPPITECKATHELITHIGNPSIFHCIKRKDGIVVPPSILDCAGLDNLIATVEAAQRALSQNKTSDTSGLDISWLTKSAFDLSTCPASISSHVYLARIDMVDQRSCFKDIVVNITSHFRIDMAGLLIERGENIPICLDIIRQTLVRIAQSLQTRSNLDIYLAPFSQTSTFTKPSRKVTLDELEDRLFHTDNGGGILNELTCLNHYPLEFPTKDHPLNTSIALDVGSDCFGGRLMLSYDITRSLNPNDPQIRVLHTWTPHSTNNTECGTIGRLEKSVQFIDREPPVFVLANGEEITACSYLNQNNEESAITEQQENLSILPSQALLLPCFSDLSDIKIYSIDNCNSTLKETKVLRRTTVRNATQVAQVLESRPSTNLRSCGDNASAIIELEAIDEKGNRATCRLHLLVSNHRSPKLVNPPIRFARFNCRRHIPHPMPIEAEMPCPTNKDKAIAFFPFHSQDAVFTSPPSAPNCENQVTLTNHWLIGTGCIPPIDFSQTIEVWDQKGPVCINSTLPSIEETYQCLRDMPIFGSQYNDVLMFMDECDGVLIAVKGKQEELLPLATTTKKPNRCLDDRQFVNSWPAKDACGNPTTLEQLNNIKDTIPPSLKADAEKRSLVCSSNSDIKSGTPNYVCFPEFQQQLGKWMIEGDNCGGPINMQIDTVASLLCTSEESTEACSVALDSTGKPPMLTPDVRRRLPGTAIAYLDKKVRPWFYLGHNRDTLCLSLRSGILHTITATRGDRCNNNAAFSWSLYNPLKSLDDEAYDPLASANQNICDQRSIVSTNTQKETATLSDFGVSYLTIKPTVPWPESLQTQINTLLETMN